MINEKQINRLITFFPILIAILMPEWAHAADSNATNSLNFNPPAQDISVIFLSNIFGVVDGVLHGTGSQIIGQMFGVFNSAVLAIGGMVAVYTTVVGTMNTAHEGEMLGKKWSSIWIPVRTVFGVGVLIPKTTGYCIMQVLVMWIVVQGVGAADKVWDAALSYLQRGGVIVQPNVNPETAFNMGGGAPSSTAKGILIGQVCMQGLQNILESQRKHELETKDSAASLCHNPNDDTTKNFCSQAVPNFLGSVNFSEASAAQRPPSCPSGTTYCVSMPGFDSASIYSQLNGICGFVSWNGLDVPGSGMTQDEIDTSNKSRNIALQQMYDTLSNVSTAMVQNDPKLNTSLSCTDDNTCVDANRAKYAFGVPLSNLNQEGCSGASCTVWGLPNGGGSTLLQGTELQGSVQDYAGIMLPTLQSLQTSDDSSETDSKAFITEARQQGWLMAGAYFFKLAQLNAAQMGSGGLNSSAASESGLSVATKKDGQFGPFSVSGFTDSLSKKKCEASGAFFCTLLDGKLSNLAALYNNGQNVDSLKSLESSSGGKAIDTSSPLSNTVFAYAINASLLSLPGQAGQTGPSFKMHFNFSPSSQVHELPPASFSGGFMGIPGTVTTLIYNGVARFIFNTLLQIAMPIVTQLFFMLVSPPILLMSNVFQAAVVKLSDPTNNPILALAQMGGAYVNGVSNLWIENAAMAAGYGMLPPVFALLMMVMPVVGAWMTVMLGVGINCAYYVPFIPYLLFTFGVFAWMIAVIESMVAAPIVALGITHPEGHEAFGKGEQAIMLILNVFLRPAMMIFGYIFGIILSYVGVWLINTGYMLTLGDIYNIGAGSAGSESMSEAVKQGAAGGAAVGAAVGGFSPAAIPGAAIGAGLGAATGAAGKAISSSQDVDKTYTQWTGIFMFFFSILIYTAMYVAVVQKAFQLIYMLPDKVLRWIGGQQEQLGGEIAGGMTKEVESQAQKAEKPMQDGISSLSKPPKMPESGDSGGGKGPTSGGGKGPAGDAGKLSGV